MNHSQQRINHLFALARKAPKVSANPVLQAPPLGFAARLATRWTAEDRRPSPADAWERLCWWGAGVAAAVCLVVAVQHHGTAEPTAFEMLLETPAEPETLI